MKRVRAAVAVGALVVAGVGTACSPVGSPSEGARIVVTTSILADIVESVAGDAASVEVLVEAGQSEHTFQASPQQVRAIAEADLVVAFGLGLEAGLDDVLEASGGDRVLEIGPLVDPIPIDDDVDEHTSEDDEHADEPASDHAGEDDGHDHDGFDPHVWLDPVRMSAVTEDLTNAILRVVPDDQAAAVRERATGMIAAITDAHDRAEALLADIPDGRRLLVTDHEALGYFAERYDFRLIGSLLPGTSTDAAPSAADVAALAQVVADLEVPAVFVDAAASDRLAQALAAEVSGVQVVPLYIGSLGPPDSAAATYPDLIVENARRVAEALG